MSRRIVLVSILLLSSLSPRAALAEGPSRSLTLDEALGLARQHNRDIAVAREHLNQVATDIDKAWANLLPVVNMQGKYTLNNKEVTLSLAPGPLSALSGQLQKDIISDLYAKAAAAGQGGPSAAVTAEQAQIANYCAANPNSSECSSAPIVIQKQNQLDFSLSATVPIIVPWAWQQLKAAREGLVAQQKTTEATEAQVLLQVAAAFYAAAGNDERTTALGHGVEVARKTADDARTRLAAGVVNRVDVARADVALMRAEQTLREQLDTTSVSYRSLRTLIGLGEPFHVVPVDEPAPAARNPLELVHSAWTLRREVLAYDRQLIAADANALSARLRWAPTLSAFGLFRAFNYAGFADQNWAAAAGLQLDWILYDAGSRQALDKQFSSLAREIKLRREQAKDQIADDVANLLGNLETKRTGLTTARREVELARETLELVRVQRDAGTATQLDLLSAQDSLVNAELRVANLRFDLGLTELQLERAAGTFPK